MSHPLKNPNCLYYELWAGFEAIDVIEQLFTTEERLVWAKISLLNYQLRLAKKEGTDIIQEQMKMETYKAYIALLTLQLTPKSDIILNGGVNA